ncbi:general stress protein 13 [Natronobacillus azotifigens]|uniref:S1 domain-containing post-transcriptional regulator GSP13 n=1 Tax=Natronobacillus azotifigens TaxID=472978 RepID=A0A9J6RFY8_9BACI|nr:S1 domain-containing post-transcriptional regulator GSP13 [Natronobacillus azotifigens]MCZ0704251.1 S1 domain-containing post-transcriptional regulator GSP13 [Natronobacillus azotifigens]
MSEKFTEGQVLEGKVTGVQPYGAFVALDDNVQGLVHISEVTHGFVKDIHEFISVGDEVKVKILSIDEEKNKYSLSIRATEEAPKEQPKAKQSQSQPKVQQEEQGFNTLKDKLSEWLKQSEEDKK